ncbi:MAG: competence protein ComEA [Flavipsychrobacter sp.]|nr:competence protein ComEA [Flavipsychrobacter sp.]
MSFTRTERNGLIALCSLIIILIVVRATMYLWVHPPDNAEQNKKLAAAWEVFKRSQPVAPADDTTGEAKNDYQDAYDENETPLPDKIDINTVDSPTLVRLKGIGPVTAGKIIAYRNKNGAFTSIDQIAALGSFNDATFAILKKHLVITAK